jgi:hypothetical protein
MKLQGSITKLQGSIIKIQGSMCKEIDFNLLLFIIFFTTVNSRNPQMTTTKMASRFVSYAIRYYKTYVNRTGEVNSLLLNYSPLNRLLHILTWLPCFAL